MERRTVMAGLASAGLVGAATRPAAAADDIVDKIISIPSPTSFRVDGIPDKPEIRSDSTVQGGKALRVHVPGKAAESWAVAVAVPIVKPVKAGDKIVLAFWVRLVEGENGATSAVLPYNSVQLADAPYTAVFFGAVTIGPEWKLHSVTSHADKDYKARALNVSIHLATAKQTVDLGPVFVLDMGQT